MYGSGKEQPEENIVKSIINLFKLKKIEVIKDRIIRYIRTLYKQEDNYYKPARVGNFLSNNYMKYESSDNRNKCFSVKEYLEKIKPYLREIIIILEN